MAYNIRIQLYYYLEKLIEKCFKTKNNEEENSQETQNYKIKQLDSEVNTFEKKFKLDDTNINNDYKNKDDIEIMKMDNFIQDSEKINNNIYIK